MIGRISREVKIARRFIALHKIEIPFDLEAIVKEYATLEYKNIPVEGVDGVTVDLKVPGKIPTIIVNNNQPNTRKRFTLAHELGHVIIPWHTGTIVDDIYSPESLEMNYWFLELEANSFAAEILMPYNWVLKIYQENDSNLKMTHAGVAGLAKVSDIAAAIRLTQVLSPELVFILTDALGRISSSGKTEGTTAILPEANTKFKTDYFKHVKEHYSYASGMNTYHWFDLNASMVLDISDSRAWREILTEITEEIKPEKGVEKFKLSINGIVSAAHSTVKRNSNYSIDSIIVAITNRLQREGLDDFISHRYFDLYVQKRAYDFYHNINIKSKK